MTATRESKRIPIEQGLATYYRNKFAQQTGRKPEEYASLWVSWDDDKRAYSLRGDGLPSHPDLAVQHPNGWCLNDYVTPTKAAELLGLSAPKREQSKRILSVTLKRIADYDADTSHLGEFSDTANDYAIVHQGEYAGEFVSELPCECGHTKHTEQHADDDCDCEDYDPVTVQRGREYRYFNSASVEASNSDEDNRKYAQWDYKEMTGLQNNEWGYIGVKAEAKIAIPDGGVTSKGETGIVQTIHSGGLWGIESHSEPEYLTQIENEQLDELRDQLHAIGFSKRAIAASFRNVERKEE